MQNHTDKEQQDNDDTVYCAGQHISGIAAENKRTVNENQDKGPVGLDLDPPDASDL